MGSIADTIRLVILHIFGWLLPTTLLVWFYLMLDSHGLNPFRSMKRFIGSIPPVGRVVFCALLVGFIVYGSTKNDGDTNAPSSRMSAPRRMGNGQWRMESGVTAEDIAHGWRVVTSAEAELIVDMPAGAVTNDLLRRRGGYDWAFRVEPEGWRFPYRDGVLDGVTVLARGEVRPDVGTLYFPVPFTNGVSLLPEARWGLLDHAEPQSRREGSVFSHAVTTNGSLLLDWHNALVGRNVNTPTNLQMELFSDGSFAWRTDDVSTSYLPVFPFDWDGDGLENSVDPEPLSPNPIDAHGTNAEWYRIVCSNVFEVTGTTGVSPVDDDSASTGTTGILPVDGGSVQFKTNVNSRAYYFVDVVASSGPAPIYFNADRDSRLGSPVVIARAGETNHVLLLIGVEYTVTSTVPISVSAPEAMYATVTTNDERSVTAKWPLEFEFVEETSGTYTVNVVPFDPGGTFTWDCAPSSGGALLLSAVPSSTCGCWSGYGPRVSFNCSDVCTCYGGCSASGTFTCEVEYSVTGGVCLCGHDDEHHEDHPPPPPDPLVGGLSITFSRKAVIFEEEYRNSPNAPLVPRRSTTTRLTVSASGGVFGGAFTLTPQNLDKLSIQGEGGAVFLTAKSLEPFETYYATFVCEGVDPSESEDDVCVSGVFLGGSPLETSTLSDATTVIRVELEAEKFTPADSSFNRHQYGVFEIVKLLHMPEDLFVQWSMSGGGTTNTSEEGYVGMMWEDSRWKLRCPLYSKGIGLTARWRNVKWPFNVVIQEPSSLRVDRPGPSDFDIFPNGISAAGMRVTTYLLPDTVNFQEISLQEIPVEGEVPINDGCFTNFPISLQTHTFTAGAGRWRTPDNRGRLGMDRVSCQPIPRCNPPPGWQYLYLPWGWNKKVDYLVTEGVPLVRLDDENGQPYAGGECFSEITTRYDSVDLVFADGSVSVSRYGLDCIRTTNGIYSLNGSLVQ